MAVSTFHEVPFNSQGIIHSLLSRFIEFITHPISFSLFHLSLNPLLQKRYVLLLPQLIAQLNFSKFLMPIILSNAVNVNSPHELFDQDNLTSQILAQWVSQNINFHFGRSFQALLTSMQTRSRLQTRSKCTHLSKILLFLNDYPQPVQFLNFCASFCGVVAARYPGYELIALGKFFFLRYLCPLIRLIGENQHHSFSMIEDGITTLVLSLQAPRSMLPRHSDRDIMMSFLSKLKDARSLVSKVPHNPQFITFVAMTPSDYLEFFEFVPKLSSDFHLRLRERKHHHLEEKWIFLMLEWSSQIDKLVDIPSPKKHLLLFMTVDSEMEEPLPCSSSIELDDQPSDKAIKRRKQNLMSKKKHLVSLSSSNSSCITDHSYLDDITIEDLHDSH